MTEVLGVDYSAIPESDKIRVCGEAALRAVRLSEEAKREQCKTADVLERFSLDVHRLLERLDVEPLQVSKYWEDAAPPLPPTWIEVEAVPSLTAAIRRLDHDLHCDADGPPGKSCRRLVACLNRAVRSNTDSSTPHTRLLRLLGSSSPNAETECEDVVQRVSASLTELTGEDVKDRALFPLVHQLAAFAKGITEADFVVSPETLQRWATSLCVRVPSEVTVRTTKDFEALLRTVDSAAAETFDELSTFRSEREELLRDVQAFDTGRFNIDVGQSFTLQSVSALLNGILSERSALERTVSSLKARVLALKTDARRSDDELTRVAETCAEMEKICGIDQPPQQLLPKRLHTISQRVRQLHGKSFSVAHAESVRQLNLAASLRGLTKQSMQLRDLVRKLVAVFEIEPEGGPEQQTGLGAREALLETIHLVEKCTQKVEVDTPTEERVSSMVRRIASLEREVREARADEQSTSSVLVNTSKSVRVLLAKLARYAESLGHDTTNVIGNFKEPFDEALLSALDDVSDDVELTCEPLTSRLRSCDALVALLGCSPPSSTNPSEVRHLGNRTHNFANDVDRAKRVLAMLVSMTKVSFLFPQALSDDVASTEACRTSDGTRGDSYSFDEVMCDVERLCSTISKNLKMLSIVCSKEQSSIADCVSVALATLGEAWDVSALADDGGEEELLHVQSALQGRTSGPNLLVAESQNAPSLLRRGVAIVASFVECITRWRDSVVSQSESHVQSLLDGIVDNVLVPLCRVSDPAIASSCDAAIAQLRQMQPRDPNAIRVVESALSLVSQVPTYCDSLVSDRERALADRDHAQARFAVLSVTLRRSRGPGVAMPEDADGHDNTTGQSQERRHGRDPPIHGSNLVTSKYFESVVEREGLSLDHELSLRRQMSPPPTRNADIRLSPLSPKRERRGLSTELNSSVARLHRTNGPQVGGGPVLVKAVPRH
uniref:Uncharacterized protein n=1 Tax=Neobodo designis TaxID=312471 RepID=A0A7S1KWP7_NEODS